MKKELAQRLKHVHVMAALRSNTWIDEVTFGAVAEECIRQMEWARHTERKERAEWGMPELDPTPQLTIAPMDWKPE